MEAAACVFYGSKIIMFDSDGFVSYICIHKKAKLITYNFSKLLVAF
jgi:hypothetical protein